MKKLKIYISGKIRNKDGNPVNIEGVTKKFCDAERVLTAIGYEVVNPTNNGIPWVASREEHMKKDIEILLPCDYIYMLDDWEDSDGAHIELGVAKCTGIRAMYDLGFVYKYLDLVGEIEKSK